MIPAALLRIGITGEAVLIADAFVFANVSLFVFHLMPIPGLDGARILAMFLPPGRATVYANLDQYLVLFILVIFFLLAGAAAVDRERPRRRRVLADRRAVDCLALRLPAAAEARAIIPAS